MTMPQHPKSLPMHTVPGVLVSPLSRHARLQGTGLEVWEIVAEFQAVDRDFARLQAAFDWLTAEQLQWALRFAELNPEFIAERLARESEAPRRLTELWKRRPETKPPHLR
jgi:uncharacterized protein (DUF433 family)